MPVAANGIQISYTDSGGQGPAVVFSHGYLLDQGMSGRQVAALAPRFRVITWDQRGARRHPGGRSVHLLGFGRPARCWTTSVLSARCRPACARAASCRCARR